MTQQVINVGAVANDGTGDPLRTAFQKANGNFSELYVSSLSVDTHNTTYTFLPGDAGRLLKHSEATSRIWTIALNASQAFPVGSVVLIYNAGAAGVLSITPAGGVTLSRTDSLADTGTRLVSANSLASIIQVDVDSWIISGTFS
jgi:hypothetical protein